MVDHSPRWAVGARWTLALFDGLRAASREIVAVAYCDRCGRILGMRHCVGEAAAADVPVREIVRDALSLDAAVIVIAHNHPSGDHRPSSEDVLFTLRFARTLEGVGIELADHLIVARDRHTSLRAEGYL